MAVHWLQEADGKTSCWYPPKRWQNKPAQFRMEPFKEGPGEWFEVTDGHLHVSEIRTVLFKDARDWLDNVSIYELDLYILATNVKNVRLLV